MKRKAAMMKQVCDLQKYSQLSTTSAESFPKCFDGYHPALALNVGCYLH